MQKYIARRLLLFIPTLVLGSLVVFGIMRFLPGDVALVILSSDDSSVIRESDLRELRESLGLGDSLPEQYGDWLWSMVSGGFGGASLVNDEPIGEIIARRLPVTIQLAVYTMTLSVLVAVPLGIIAAVFQDKLPDYLARFVSVSGLSLPNFWVALLLLLIMVTWFNWSPPIIYTNLWEDPWNHLQIAIWPALILGWQYTSYISRVTRSSMLETLRQDYIRTAHSKGLTALTVLRRHALRNSLIPVITISAAYLGSVLSGTVILEGIFGMPGIGQGVVKAAQIRDYPVMQSLVMLLVFITLALNLVVDLIYVAVDPRVRYS